MTDGNFVKNAVLHEIKQARKRFIFMYPYRWRMITGFGFMLLAVTLQLAFPLGLSHLLDSAKAPSSLSSMLVTGVTVFLAIIIYCVASSLRFYCFETAGVKMVTDIQRKLFSTLISQPIMFFDKSNAAELNSRLQSDVYSLQSLLSLQLAIGVRSLIILSAGTGFLIYLSPEMSLVLALVFPITFILGRYFGQKLQRFAKVLQTHSATCLQYAQEQLDNVRVVHAFGQQNNAIKTYHQKTQHALEAILGNTKVSSAFQSSSQMVSLSALLLMVLSGAFLVSRQQLTLGQLTGFVIYAGLVTNAISSALSVWTAWKQSSGATERVFDLLERSTPNTRQGQVFHTLSNTLCFSNIELTYASRQSSPVLRGVSFSLRKGEHVAIVGPSGSGKSTIAKLLMGFYTPSQGQILFDGKPFSSFAVHSLRQSICMVEQEPSLFTGTVAQNIAYGIEHRDATVKEIQQAAKLACAHEFIMTLPDQYNTHIGDKGVQLSGGQKQRIAIARAILRDPLVLILDEATSALDSHSEKLVQKALKKAMKGRTTLVIAHRQSTIDAADRVIYLSDGRCVEHHIPIAREV